MKRYFSILLLVAFTSCGLLGGNDYPDIPGKLVFTAPDQNGTDQIFTMNANGSGVKQLTTSSERSTSPSWSPNGNKIIFSRIHSTNAAVLWTMGADGSGQKIFHKFAPPIPPGITILGGEFARWSPDENKIVFELCEACELISNHEIYVFDTVTFKRTKLTNHPTSDRIPKMSPDGSKVAFYSERDYYDAEFHRFRDDIYLIDSDGSNLRRLTEIGYISQFTWKNDTELLFTKYDVFKSNQKELFVLNIETGAIDSVLKLEGSQLFLFWDLTLEQLVTLEKKDNQLPVNIRIYDLEGSLIKDHVLDTPVFKSARGFHWINVQ